MGNCEVRHDLPGSCISGFSAADAGVVGTTALLLVFVVVMVVVVVTVFVVALLVVSVGMVVSVMVVVVLGWWWWWFYNGVCWASYHPITCTARTQFKNLPELSRTCKVTRT
jgi:hypothetical protein